MSQSTAASWPATYCPRVLKPVLRPIARVVRRTRDGLRAGRLVTWTLHGAASAKGLAPLGLSRVEPLRPLPLRPDDPRLDGWYHTIDLAPGVASRGVFDHRGCVDRAGIPASLAGKTVLDVGTADGFWAFEMERRGADRVVAIDVARVGDRDFLPTKRARMDPADLGRQGCREHFATAHRMRRSRVEYRICSVYELSPETVGATFDMVYCGDLLLHLKNPLQALLNIRSVTKGAAVIVTGALGGNVEASYPDLSLVRFGHLHAEQHPGDNNVYWEFSRKALHDMLIYAGFASVELRERLTVATTYPGAPPLYEAVVAVAHV